jgi:hypothetical protein
MGRIQACKPSKSEKINILNVVTFVLALFNPTQENFSLQKPHFKRVSIFET